jgi:hypothetical protein
VIEPDTIEVGGQLLCRVHHTPLVFDPGWAFNVCANYAGMGRPAEAFPNAKWGHPAQPGFEQWELVGLWHCPACEQDRQRWLAAQDYVERQPTNA